MEILTILILILAYGVVGYLIYMLGFFSGQLEAERIWEAMFNSLQSLMNELAQASAKKLEEKDKEIKRYEDKETEFANALAEASRRYNAKHLRNNKQNYGNANKRTKTAN
jgi:hypothetical protein